MTPTMKKVAVFGNTGGGKSTLSRELANLKQLPLFVIDKIKFRPGGVEVSEEEYRQSHRKILAMDAWVIDGFGSLETVWQQLDAADSLVYIDLPLPLHGWWVTKRMLKGVIRTPEGWPDRSPILKSTLKSYRILWLCHQRLTPMYRAYVQQARATKTVYHLRSPRAIAQFLTNMAQVP